MFEILSICKGGGYHYCRTSPPHPKRNAKGLYPLHRVILENKIGRPLLSNEQAHHKDGNKHNNNPDNIELQFIADHAKIHHPVIEEIKIFCICCGDEFKVKPRIYRTRLNRNKSKNVYCSAKCAAIFIHNNRISKTS